MDDGLMFITRLPDAPLGSAYRLVGGTADACSCVALNWAEAIRMQRPPHRGIGQGIPYMDWRLVGDAVRSAVLAQEIVA